VILYYSSGACSIVPHIALEEADSEFEARRVPIVDGANQTPEYLAINPNGRLPALDTGTTVVTENIAVLTYIALTSRAAGSVPLDDREASARCMQLLSWFASSVHIAFAQVWRPERFTDDSSVHSVIQDGGKELLEGYFKEIEGLVGDGWVAGGSFTAADSYLLCFFRWGRRIGMEMHAFPKWAALSERVLGRPAVQRVIVREGLDIEQFRLSD